LNPNGKKWDDTIFGANSWKNSKRDFTLGRILQLPNVVFAYIIFMKGDIIKPISYSAARPACIIVQSLLKKYLKPLTKRVCEIFKIKLY
jgi:hypothetical protein